MRAFGSGGARRPMVVGTVATLISIPLNGAEGAYSRGRNQQARFQTAAGSARETLACLETAEALGFMGPLSPELGARFDHVIGTLVRLIAPRVGTGG